jgi:TPR repeat protein
MRKAAAALPKTMQKPCTGSAKQPRPVAGSTERPRPENAQAMRNLGALYAEGRGGFVKDEAEAVRWYRKAAEAGHIPAIYSLGVLYAESRLGLAKDEVEALRWFRKAEADEQERS